MATKPIISRPDVMFGKPCFEGTRIPVDVIQEALAAGTSVEQLLEGYARLSQDHIEAAWTYPLPSSTQT